MRPSAGFIKFNRKGKKLSAELIEKKFWKRKTELPTGHIGLYDRYLLQEKREKFMKIPRPLGIVMKMIDIYERNYFP